MGPSILWDIHTTTDEFRKRKIVGLNNINLTLPEHHMDERIEKILNRYPFLSYGTMLDVHYLGIIQNSDTQLLSMYVLDMIPTEAERREFVACGETWWMESNRQVPINIFLGGRMRQFRPYLKHFSRKDFQLLAGPTVSLQETIARRVRRRQVTLVRKII